MFKLALGVAIGWMTFDEQGKKFANKTGGKLKNISKDTIMKAKDALENVQELKDLMANFSNTPGVIDAANASIASPVVMLPVAAEEASSIDAQNTPSII